jgi:hypothetical protein
MGELQSYQGLLKLKHQILWRIGYLIILNVSSINYKLEKEKNNSNFVHTP